MTSEPVTVGGRYQLGGLLGRGGMAEVRQAADTRLGRQVAVKQLRADLATDPTFQARFRREAQSAAGLNHPTIVAVYDTGEEADPRTGVSVPYIVMELVEGPTLRDVLRDGRKILPERALELTQGVLDALSYSHKAGIVHRDIKPANVMLTPSGGVKVMDFGIARAVADTSATMTQTAAVIGTAQYLSPEQARGETVDFRSDIYSAGCLLYELLVGRPPFIGDSPVSVAYQHVREEPVPPSQLDPVVTAEIDAITLKALAKSPDDRYQSAREMKNDISRLLAGQQVTALVPAVSDPDATRVVPSVVAAAPAPPADPPYDPNLDDEEEPKRRVGLAIFIAGLIVVLLAAGAFALYRWMQPLDPGASASPTPQMVEVPSVLGYPETQAKSVLENAGLTAKPKSVNGDEETKGEVTKQTPVGTTQVVAGSEVVIEVNAGPETAEIPEGLEGLSYKKAKKKLEEAGFENVRPQDTQEEEPVESKKNEVLSVEPGEGEAAALDDEITLTVATGFSEVPELTGRLPDVADKEAAAKGFQTETKEVTTDEQQPGNIFRQDPQPGSRLERGKTIDIFVAVEPTPPPVSTPPPTSASPETSASPSATPTG